MLSYRPASDDHGALPTPARQAALGLIAYLVAFVSVLAASRLLGRFVYLGDGFTLFAPCCAVLLAALALPDGWKWRWIAAGAAAGFAIAALARGLGACFFFLG